MVRQAKSAYWQNVVDQAVARADGASVPFFSLAPMEAVTDTVFRRVVEQAAGPDVYYTEFTKPWPWCIPRRSNLSKDDCL